MLNLPQADFVGNNIGIYKGCIMNNSKKIILKNDQNNHLNDQIEGFGEFSVVSANKNEYQAYSAEANMSDDVTWNYVRGYN